ncbi:unnamed protein product, partial [Iphiclides podalirius]
MPEFEVDSETALCGSGQEDDDDSWNAGFNAKTCESIYTTRERRSLGGLAVVQFHIYSAARISLNPAGATELDQRFGVVDGRV